MKQLLDVSLVILNGRELTSKIKEDLMIHAKGEGSTRSPGAHVGTVDHMDGENYIKLNKKDLADGKHHWIPVGGRISG